MFNLIMLSVDWEDSGRASVPAGRMFEYTDDHIADQFRDEAGPALDRLAVLPCLFMKEGNRDEVAYVGQINRARRVGSDVSFEYAIDAEVPPLENHVIYANRMALDMPPLRAVARIARSGNVELKARLALIESELPDVLRELHAEQKSKRATTLIDGPIWTDLSVHLGLNLSPSPLDELAALVTEASSPEAGLALACQSLLDNRSSFETEATPTSVVANAVDRFSRWRQPDGRCWPDWVSDAQCCAIAAFRQARQK